MDFLTSLISEAIKASTPLLLASLGEIYTERSGVLNLGIEGIMAIGAFFGFLTVYTTNSLILGFLVAAIAGLIFSSIHATVSVILKANQTISGLAISMLGLGITSVIGINYIGSPLTISLQPVKISPVSEIPIIGAFFSQDVLVYFSFALTLILWYFLNYTRYGLQIRAVGENPEAADASGVNVDLVRYVSTIFGGALQGLAGAYISLAYLPGWIDGITQGRGWIAVALTVVSLWDPIKCFVVALMFGSVSALRYALQPIGVPSSLLAALPYVATIIFMAFGTILLSKRRIKPPAALGVPYTRE